MPDVVTLPQHFKNHGYRTQSIGKIFHGSGKPSRDPPSWSVEPMCDVSRDVKVRYMLPKNRNNSGLKQAATESADVQDASYLDGVVCDTAEAAIEKPAAEKDPFFLALSGDKGRFPSGMSPRVNLPRLGPRPKA